MMIIFVVDKNEHLIKEGIEVFGLQYLKGKKIEQLTVVKKDEGKNHYTNVDKIVINLNTGETLNLGPLGTLGLSEYKGTSGDIVTLLNQEITNVYYDSKRIGDKDDGIWIIYSNDVTFHTKKGIYKIMWVTEISIYYENAAEFYRNKR